MAMQMPWKYSNRWRIIMQCFFVIVYISSIDKVLGACDPKKYTVSAFSSCCSANDNRVRGCIAEPGQVVDQWIDVKTINSTDGKMSPDYAQWENYANVPKFPITMFQLLDSVTSNATDM